MSEVPIYRLLTPRSGKAPVSVLHGALAVLEVVLPLSHELRPVVVVVCPVPLQEEEI